MIAVTAYAMRGDRERFLNAGCVYDIEKTIDLEEFRKTLVKYVEKGYYGNVYIKFVTNIYP